MKHTIIGTAGHVDHGKTLLIKALTGVDCDRLKEEKERGLTTDLGYTYLDLPDGNSVSIIDVPGHEKFIKNMLAGAGVIDNVLLVVAADEGAMPQTIEHFNIVNLLGVKNGIIVITKVDLADKELVYIVEDDIAELVCGTALENAPVVHTSAVTSEGIKELKQEIAKLVEKFTPRSEERPFRLPIDRVFKIHGVGTIVAGTAFSGKVKVGDRLELLPLQREVRVRGMQTHDENVDLAKAGDRVAINLVGVDAEEIQRGHVLSQPDYLEPTENLDVHLNLLTDSSIKLENWMRVRLYLASSEVFGRAVLLDRDVLKPGEDAFVQFRLESPVVTEYGDRFVIRQYSPLNTIGGGVVVDPYPPKHKRFDQKTIEQLNSLEHAETEERVKITLLDNDIRITSRDYLVKRLNLTDHELDSALEKLSDEIVKFDEGRYMIHADKLEKLKDTILDSLRKFHQENPFKLGVSKEEIRSRFRYPLELTVYNEILTQLIDENKIVDMDERMAFAGYSVELTDSQEKIKQQLEQTFLESGFSTPLPEDVLSNWSDNKVHDVRKMLELLLESDVLVKVDEKVIMHKKNLDRVRDLIVEFLQANNKLMISDCRELLGTTRKYILPLLYYLDNIGVTRRVGDYRVLTQSFDSTKG